MPIPIVEVEENLPVGDLGVEENLELNYDLERFSACLCLLLELRRIYQVGDLSIEENLELSYDFKRFGICLRRLSELRRIC